MRKDSDDRALRLKVGICGCVLLAAGATGGIAQGDGAVGWGWLAVAVIGAVINVVYLRRMRKRIRRDGRF